MKFKILACLISACCLLAGCEKTDRKYEISEAAVTNETQTECGHDYSSVIAGYMKFAEVLINEQVSSIPVDLDFSSFEENDEELIYDWGCMLAEMMIWSCQSLSKEKDYFGYALKDLNNDKTSELILLTKDFDILAIFTTINDKPKLVDAYWSRHRCAIYDSNTLYTYSSSGAANYCYRLQVISQNTGELVTLKEYGSDTDHYYKIINGEQSVISESEYEEFEKTYPVLFYDVAMDFNKNSGIEFMPFSIDGT
ncbi:MAG: hypothetical protein J1E35_07260 [Lachnospiraceae bacterium]|nr:hypothetical protein [Lachnospiraceae bacterium]